MNDAVKEIIHLVGGVADLVTICAVAAGLLLWTSGRNPLVGRAMNADRRRSVGDVLALSGMSRAAVRRAVVRSTRSYVDGDARPTVQAELDWLDEVVGRMGGRTPVSYHGLPSMDRSRSLSSLADAYRNLALRLRGRSLVGGGSTPLIEEISSVAEQMSGLLARNATFAAGTPGEMAELELTAHAGSTMLVLHHLRPSEKPGAGVDDVAVSYSPRRLVVTGTISEQLAELDGIDVERLDLTPGEFAELGKSFVGKTFDGVLPSLRAARVERDPASGRSRLHCVLEEASFSSVVASHYVGGLGDASARDELRQRAGLLTLAILPSTVDGYLVLTRRSEHVSVSAGQVSPAVTGNLEMRDRTGLAVDRDADGTPDPLSALARECREELGLEVDRNSIGILATMVFSSAHEVGTTVLLTTAQLDLTLQQAADRAVFADRIEGAWESEEEIIGVPVPRTTDERLRLLAWTLSNPHHVPHLSGTLVAMFYPHLCAELGRDRAEERIRQLGGRPVEAPAPAGIRTVRCRDAEAGRASSSWWQRGPLA